MKNRLFKVMLATGAVAMICACGDDSGSGNDTPATNSADSGLPVTNPCAGYTVFHAGWIVELAPGDYLPPLYSREWPLAACGTLQAGIATRPT